MALDDVADELYGLLPAEFIGVRTERARQAKAAGDSGSAKAIAALRKPTVAGWLANALVRHRRADVDEVLALGDELRAAQQGMDGEALRTLAGRRQRLLAAASRLAGALAAELGQPVSPAVVDEVLDTLGAALADPASADQLRAGRLTGALSYAGLGGPAGPGGPPRLSLVRAPAGSDQTTAGATHHAGPDDDAAADDDTDDPSRALEDAAAALVLASTGLRTARAAHDAADQARQEAHRARLQAGTIADQARFALDQAERELSRAQRAEDQAERTLALADGALAEARQADQQARQALREAQRGQ